MIHSDTVRKAISAVAWDMATRGWAFGITDFDTADEAEDFRDVLSEKYPPEGYGTYSTAALHQDGHFLVKWRVDSCD